MSDNDKDGEYITRGELTTQLAQLRRDIKHDTITIVSEVATQILTVMAERFEQIDRRFEQVDRRFERIDRRFEQIDVRFQRMDERLDRLEVHLDTTEEQVKQIGSAVQLLNYKITPQAEINRSFELRLTKLESA
jgi:septal ring factor EnvC (AmiA/AmiB activator)